MNTVMKSQVHGDNQFCLEPDWSTLMVKIKRMLSAMGVAMPDLEDLVQEVCIKIIGCRVRVTYRRWLRVVARHVIADFYRREYRRAEGISRNKESIFSEEIDSYDPEESESRLALVANPIKDVLEFDFSEAIEREFANLDLTQRQTMLLYEQGLQYEQIAVLIGAPIGTVRSRIYYGKRKLRARLASYR